MRGRHRRRPSAAVPTGEDAVRSLSIVALGYAVIALADATVKWVLPEIGRPPP